MIDDEAFTEKHVCWPFHMFSYMSTQYISLELTSTLMVSCRGPLVFKLSLLFSMVYSHSKPISMKVLLLTPLLLGFRIKLPEAWFLTAGETSSWSNFFSVSMLNFPVEQSKSQNWLHCVISALWLYLVLFTIVPVSIVSMSQKVAFLSLHVCRC